MPRKILLAAIVALAAALTVPALAPAAKKTRVSVGMGDQSPSVFAHKDFKRLKIKKARYFVNWRTMSDPYRLGQAEAWVAEARKRKVRVLFHVDGVFTKKLPTVKQYRRNVGKLVRHFRKRGVKEWGVWNEVNSPTQPTSKKPKRVAQFFVEMRKMCKKCSIVALDVLDSGKMKGYIKSFYRALGKRKRFVKIVGIHNYGDTNRKRRNNTGKIINWVRRYGGPRGGRKAKFYITETGGLAHFKTEKKTVFKCNPKRQAKAIKKMFSIARKHRRHVKRLYSYNFFGTGSPRKKGRKCSRTLRFDAGLMQDGEGKVRRPAYKVFRTQLKKFIK